MLWELGFWIGSSESASDWQETSPLFLRVSTPNWALPRSGKWERLVLSTGSGTCSLEASRDAGGVGTISKAGF